MLEQNIYISERLLNNLKAFCEANSLDVNDYITECIEVKLNTDMYGDLNEIFGLNNKQNGEKVVEPVKDEEKPLEKVEQPEIVEQQPQVEEGNVEEEPKKPVRIKRKLKTK